MIWKIYYSESAKEDLISIFEYISIELAAPQAARALLDRMFKTVRSLEELPLRHPVYNAEPWKTRNIRFIPVDNYIVFYLIDEKTGTVNVVRIIYAGRDIKNQA